MIEWLEMNPEKLKEFRDACDEWTSQIDQPQSRWTAIKEFVKTYILIPVFERVGAHGMAYKLGGIHRSRCKRAYLCSRWRNVLVRPKKAAIDYSDEMHDKWPEE